MLDIIIVNWNAGPQLADVIASIRNYHSDLVSSVIIVDNASTDNSIDQLNDQSSTLPFPFHIIRNKDNRGFSAACNQGAALARSEYLLFLNPDIRLFENSLSVPLTFMQQLENAHAGICGIQLINEAGSVSRTCRRYPSVGKHTAEALGLTKLMCFISWNHHMLEWDHCETREVDQLMGSFFFVRKKVFDGLKGFDERYFVYFEEVDFSYRARMAGYRSVFLADAQAFHAGGGTSHQVKAFRLFYSLRSRLLYGFKHFSRSSAIMLLAITMLIEPVSRTVYSFVRGGVGDVSNTLAAYAMLWSDLPNIFKKGFRHA